MSSSICALSLWGWRLMQCLLLYVTRPCAYFCGTSQWLHLLCKPITQTGLCCTCKQFWFLHTPYGRMLHCDGTTVYAYHGTILFLKFHFDSPSSKVSTPWLLTSKASITFLMRFEVDKALLYENDLFDGKQKQTFVKKTIPNRFLFELLRTQEEEVVISKQTWTLN